MAKQRKTPADTPARKGSRHAPRNTIALSAELYAALAKLAEQNARPINWEARLHIEKACAAAGLWPPGTE